VDGFKIYGSPWQPAFCNWAFNLQRKQLAEVNIFYLFLALRFGKQVVLPFPFHLEQEHCLWESSQSSAFDRVVKENISNANFLCFD